MKMTSAQAAKELRKLNDQHNALLEKENKSKEFVASIQEDVEQARPDYDYAGTQAELAALESQIRRLKHAISTFNLQQEVPGFGMTIDQILVYIPQLTARKRKLDHMRKKLRRERVDAFARTSNIVEYTYANYDIQKAEEDYVKAADELAAAQNALDQLNSTVEFDVDI